MPASSIMSRNHVLTVVTAKQMFSVKGTDVPSVPRKVEISPRKLIFRSGVVVDDVCLFVGVTSWQTTPDVYFYVIEPGWKRQVLHPNVALVLNGKTMTLA